MISSIKDQKTSKISVYTNIDKNIEPILLKYRAFSKKTAVRKKLCQGMRNSTVLMGPQGAGREMGAVYRGCVFKKTDGRWRKLLA